MYPNSSLEMDSTTEVVEVKRSDVKIEIAWKVLEELGSLYPTRELTRTRIKGELVTASSVNEAVNEMERRGLGEMKKVKLGKTKPQNVKKHYQQKLAVIV